MKEDTIITGKAGMEKVVISGRLPEINTLIADACMVPIVKDKGRRSYTSQYKAPAHVKNHAYMSWLKRLIHEKPNYNLEIFFSGNYEPMPFIDEKISSALYFDGSYVNKAMTDFKGYDCIFSIYYNTGHKKRIEESANYMGLEIDEWFHVDFGKHLDVNHRYIHGSKWLAACVGGSFSNNVLIPSTIDFWSTERSEFIYTEGADWISRYYGKVVGLHNPIKENKVDILRSLRGKYNALIPCRCGKCMECITTYVVIDEKLGKDFYNENPRRSEESIRKLRSAVFNDKADIYREFFEE